MSEDLFTDFTQIPHKSGQEALPMKMPVETKKQNITTAMQEYIRNRWPDIIACAFDIMDDVSSTPQDKLRAADLLLKRGFGKETEYVEANITGSQAPLTPPITINVLGGNRDEEPIED